MEEREILQHILNSAREDLDFYSNAGKPFRERWVVSEFLNMLGVQFEESEVESLEQGSKIDVKFRNANFQVKEIPNPGILRGKIIKDTYNSIKLANNLEDIELPSQVHDLPEITRMYDLVLSKAKELSESEGYIKSKQELDLILYITRSRASLIQNEEIKTKVFF